MCTTKPSLYHLGYEPGTHLAKQAVYQLSSILGHQPRFFSMGRVVFPGILLHRSENIFNIYSVIRLFTNYKHHIKIKIENSCSRFFLLFIPEFTVGIGHTRPLHLYSQVSVLRSIWVPEDILLFPGAIYTKTRIVCPMELSVSVSHS